MLGSGWELSRDDTAVGVAGGTLTMAAPDGADLYGTFLAAPRVVRPVTGDFVATAGVEARPKQFYQGAGLVLWGGPDRFVRVERGFGTYAEVIFEYRDGGAHKRVFPAGSKGPARTSAGSVILELSRRGSTVEGRWRTGTDPVWQELRSATLALPDEVEVGLSVLNRAQGGAKPAPFSAGFTSASVTC